MLLIVSSKTRAINGKIVEIAEENELVTVVSLPGDQIYFYHVLKDWLQEIEDGPVSADAWLHKQIEWLNNANIHKEDARYIWQESEKNDRKRTQPVIDAAREAVFAIDNLSSINVSDMRDALNKLKEQDGCQSFDGGSSESL